MVNQVIQIKKSFYTDLVYKKKLDQRKKASRDLKHQITLNTFKYIAQHTLQQTVVFYRVQISLSIYMLLYIRGSQETMLETQPISNQAGGTADCEKSVLAYPVQLILAEIRWTLSALVLSLSDSIRAVRPTFGNKSERNYMI